MVYSGWWADFPRVFIQEKWTNPLNWYIYIYICISSEGGSIKQLQQWYIVTIFIIEVVNIAENISFGKLSRRK